MTQVGYMGSQVVKFMFQLVSKILKSIFRVKNVTTPLKLTSKIVFGTDFKGIDPEKKKQMDKVWEIAGQQI